MQGTHCTGKTGKMAKKVPCQGKHREFGNFAKTQGIWFALVVNSLILKVKDISKFAAKISPQKKKLDKSAKSVCNSHKSRKLAQGKFAVRKGKNRVPGICLGKILIDNMMLLFQSPGYELENSETVVTCELCHTHTVNFNRHMRTHHPGCGGETLVLFFSRRNSQRGLHHPQFKVNGIEKINLETLVLRGDVKIDWLQPQYSAASYSQLT